MNKFETTNFIKDTPYKIIKNGYYTERNKTVHLHYERFLIYVRMGEVGCTIYSFICLSTGAIEW